MIGIMYTFFCSLISSFKKYLKLYDSLPHATSMSMSLRSTQDIWQGKQSECRKYQTQRCRGIGSMAQNYVREL